MATRGTSGAAPDCDCANDANGSAATRREVIKFIEVILSIQSALVSGGVLLACLIFARGTRRVTRLRVIDFFPETGHKRTSRSKELNSERGRSGTSRSDDPLSGRIAGSISRDLLPARSGSAPLYLAFGSRLRNRR